VVLEREGKKKEKKKGKDEGGPVGRGAKDWLDEEEKDGDDDDDY